MAGGSADLLGLRLSCDGVELKPPDDREIEMLVELATTPQGVLLEAESHYVTWLDKSAATIARDLATDIRDKRRIPSEGHWTLHFAVLVQGQLIGLQTLAGFDLWPRRRNVGTSAWLALGAQGSGYGTRARVGALDLAFGVLGAQAAMSWVLPDNHRSRRVSERLGYNLIKPAASPMDESKYMLTAAQWKASRPSALPPTQIDGAAPLRSHLMPRFS